MNVLETITLIILGKVRNIIKGGDLKKLRELLHVLKGEGGNFLRNRF